jgi:hypothetical protein
MRVATICSYCPDKTEGETWSNAHGFLLSHGVCAACLEKEFPGIGPDIIAKAKAQEGFYISP